MISTFSGTYSAPVLFYMAMNDVPSEPHGNVFTTGGAGDDAAVAPSDCDPPQRASSLALPTARHRRAGDCRDATTPPRGRPLRGARPHRARRTTRSGCNSVPPPGCTLPPTPRFMTRAAIFPRPSASHAGAAATGRHTALRSPVVRDGDAATAGGAARAPAAKRGHGATRPPRGATRPADRRGGTDDGWRRRLRSRRLRSLSSSLSPLGPQRPWF